MVLVLVIMLLVAGTLLLAGLGRVARDGDEQEARDVRSCKEAASDGYVWDWPAR